MNKAFFIDKDGTLVDNSGYPDIIPSDEILYEDVIEGLRHIQIKGYKIIIVSNQPWIAKGKMSREEVEDVFKSLIEKLSERKIKIDDYYYCPHQSSDNCDCKKPSPKMIFEAARKHNIHLIESYTVGDMDSDIYAGINAGTKTILVKTGRGKDFIGKLNDKVYKTLNNLNEIRDVLWVRNLIRDLIFL